MFIFRRAIPDFLAVVFGLEVLRLDARYRLGVKRLVWTYKRSIQAWLQETEENVTRPRAADDFATIRARLEELRCERAQVFAETGGRSVIHPPPHRAASSATEHKGRQLLQRLIRRKLFG